MPDAVGFSCARGVCDKAVEMPAPVAIPAQEADS